MRVLLVFVLLSTGCFYAQEDNFVQKYNPGKLLAAGQSDLFLFSSTYTQTEENWQGENIVGNRLTFARQWLQITRGVSKSGRFNLGLDIQLVNTSRSENSQSYGEIWNAYQFENGANNRFGLGAFGLRARLQPLKNVVDFTIQSSITMPGVRYPEGFSSDNDSLNLFWADWDRITSWNQFFYTFDFENGQLFTEADLLFRFPRFSTQIPMLDLPVTIIYSHFIDNWTFYGLAQNMQRTTFDRAGSDDFVIPGGYSQLGLGLKHNWSNGLQLELAYNKFVRAVNSGKGESFNLGLRYIIK